MKTKNIFKALALAMMMPAMMLTTACSNEDDAINNGDNKKGYPLQVTVNVTRQGDKATTRATYDDSEKKLSFGTGDKLFVIGVSTGTEQYAGTLDYVSEGTFTGTIYSEVEYSGSAADFLTAAESAGAILLPNGYEDYHYLTITGSGYSANVAIDATKAFAATKAAAVEQLSMESATSYSSGFALSPSNAILNFTINGLTASTNVTATLKDGNGDDMVSGVVTTDGSGNATFAMALSGSGVSYNIKDLTLTVGGNNITFTGSNVDLVAGKIYNITRSAAPAAPEGALPGKFTINRSGDKVYFSKGNLQATTTDLGANWTWAFAANQWDYIGNATANTSINGNGTVSANGTVDLFGWVGASNTTWTGATMYGISNSTTRGSADTYGNDATESLKSDWGNTIGSGWRTLTSDEWVYLFNTRTASTVGGTANARYAKATVNNTAGVILFSDSYTHPSDVTAPASINTTRADFTANTYDAAAWGKMESAGAVFLPAAGHRTGSSVSFAGSYGYYWQSSPNTSTADYASNVYFSSGYLHPQNGNYRYRGFSVRLVRAAE